MKIDSFTQEYAFLSNFYPVQVKYDGLAYPSVEHAYQAAKTTDVRDRMKIFSCKRAGDAKRMGKRVRMRPDWENMKLMVMEDLLRQKFQVPHLRKWLLDTGDVEIIEGNWWGDVYWGVCDGRGRNHLGRLLMKIRDELKENPDGQH